MLALAAAAQAADFRTTGAVTEGVGDPVHRDFVQSTEIVQSTAQDLRPFVVASAQLTSRRATDSAMEFAVLGHTAEYLLGRSGALLQIERWAPTSRYHLVTTSQKEAQRTTEQLPNGALPPARTSVHSTESLPSWAAS